MQHLYEEATRLSIHVNAVWPSVSARVGQIPDKTASSRYLATIREIRPRLYGGVGPAGFHTDDMAPFSQRFGGQLL